MHHRTASSIAGSRTGERTTVELATAAGVPFEPAVVFPERDGFLAVSRNVILARWRDGELVEQARVGTLGSTPGPGLGFLRHGAVVTTRPDGRTEASRLDLEPGALGVTLTVGPWRRDAVSAHPAPDGGLYVMDTDGLLRTYGADGSLLSEIATGSQDPVVVASDEVSGKLAFGGILGLAIVDPASGDVEQVREIGSVTSLTFVLGGRSLVVVGDDGDVQLWDVAAGESVGRIWDGTGVAQSVPSRYDPTTESVWIATSGRLLLIPLDPDDWVDRACTLVGRDLTAEEWDRFVPGNAPQQPACEPPT